MLMNVALVSLSTYLLAFLRRLAVSVCVVLFVVNCVYVIGACYSHLCLCLSALAPASSGGLLPVLLARLQVVLALIGFAVHLAP